MEMTSFDKHASAAAFAEAGEHDTAKEMLGGKKQATKTGKPQPAPKPYVQTVIYGVISLTAYFYVFQNEKWVTETFTMGGWHWVYPLGTALGFSFVHGAFGSSLLSVLGLEAKK